MVGGCPSTSPRPLPNPPICKCSSSDLPPLPPQRLFVVPANETQAKIPYARVNHSKFMVTDKVAYIGK